MFGLIEEVKASTWVEEGTETFSVEAAEIERVDAGIVGRTGERGWACVNTNCADDGSGDCPVWADWPGAENR